MSSTVVSDRFADGAGDETRVEIVTPEGVPLVFTIGRAGDRVTALLLDGLLILGALLAIYLVAVPLGGGDPWVAALLVLALFALRNGYFLWFEVRWQGRTPGKSRLGLRVIDARGRPLTTDALVVRNLTREAEIFVPLVALSNPEVIVDTGPGWVRLLSVLWFGVFIAIPLINRQRRRVGDLLAGTLVVRDPRAVLRRDLAHTKSGDELIFTTKQLAMYGVYELQVLEDLLRDEPNRSQALNVVAKKIQRKIRWPRDARKIDAREFLAAFYRAQRGRLEQDLLLGKVRERKQRGRLED